MAKSELEDYEQNYEDFWKGILEADGVLSMDQLKRELHDYYNVMQNVSHVYNYITNGKVSEPLTDPDVVCTLADETYEEIYSEGE